MLPREFKWITGICYCNLAVSISTPQHIYCLDSKFNMSSVEHKNLETNIKLTAESGQSDALIPSEKIKNELSGKDPVVDGEAVLEELEEESGLKKSLGLWNGVSIIVGSIIGSGIFIAPTGVQKGRLLNESRIRCLEAGSVGVSLLIWLISGVFAMAGAWSYAELGVFTKNFNINPENCRNTDSQEWRRLFLHQGGLRIVHWVHSILDWSYRCSTMFLFNRSHNVCQLHVETLLSKLRVACLFDWTLGRWTHWFVLDSTINGCLVFLTAINCASVRLSTFIQDTFTIAKVFALIMIILTGGFLLIRGRPENLASFQDIWKGSSSDPGQISLAFYSGLFAYQGWNYLNYIVRSFCSFVC